MVQRMMGQLDLNQDGKVSLEVSNVCVLNEWVQEWLGLFTQLKKAYQFRVSLRFLGTEDVGGRVTVLFRGAAEFPQ